MKMREKLNCPNCGAPIIGAKCEYCGTQFYDFADIELNKECYIRIKYKDLILAAKFYPFECDFEQEQPEAAIYGDDRIAICSQPEMYFSLRGSVREANIETKE